jgi:hypothetical protein
MLTSHECVFNGDPTARFLDTLSNSELAAYMGWSDVNARGPGVEADAGIAVGLLREGLPEAVEKGIVRVLDGPEYNIPLSPSDNPSLSSNPTLSMMWHVMASTSSNKVYDTESENWRVRPFTSPRFSVEYFY